jgi:hypothetical protein
MRSNSAAVVIRTLSNEAADALERAIKACGRREKKVVIRPGSTALMASNSISILLSESPR